MSRCSGRQLAQLLELAEGCQLAEGLDLDLADALAREAELLRDLVQGARVAAVEAVAHGDDDALALRFGLDGERPQTLEEVGAGLGITRERVRQLESRALRELRLTAPDLELYLRS